MSVGSMPLKAVRKNESVAAERRMYFRPVDATDGYTPEEGEAAGQPEVSINGDAWSTGEIGTLTHIGNGWYYADVTQAATNVNQAIILARYKSANTREASALYGLAVGSQNENGPTMMTNTIKLDMDAGTLIITEADGSTTAQTFTLTEVDDDTQSLVRS